MTPRIESSARAGTAPFAPPCLARQPIVDRDQRIVGYAVTFRSSEPEASTAAGLPPAEALALDGVRMLALLLGEQDAESALGRMQLFVPVSGALIATDFVDLLDPARTVLMLGPDVEPTLPTAERIDALCTRGFRIALDGAAALGSSALWLPHAALVRIDTACDAAAIAPIASTNALRRHGARLLSSGVESHAQFDALHRSGVDFFQGSWFAKPQTLRAKTIQPAWGALLRALSLAQQDAPPQAIEAALRVDAALTFRLLRYIGAAGIGGGRGPMRCVADAVSLVGYRALTRWLGMLLVTTDGGPDHASSALARTALTRARMMELLPRAKAGSGAEAAGDDAGLADAGVDAQQRFLVGLFSLMDVMLEMPMERVLDRLPLPLTVARSEAGGCDAVFRGEPTTLAAIANAGVPLDTMTVEGDRALAQRFIDIFELPPKAF